jgi:hypothetical protein
MQSQLCTLLAAEHKKILREINNKKVFALRVNTFIFTKYCGLSYEL